MNTHVVLRPARRRLLVAAAASLAAPAFVRQAMARERLDPTPAQTEGPFYPEDVTGETDVDLLSTGQLRYASGQPGWVHGVVMNTSGQPVSGAVVEIWQCDHQGRYHHPGDGGRADPAFQGYGRVQVGRDGAYRFRTIRPVPYTGRTPHIHFKVRLGTQELLTTQLYVEGDPRNPRDGIWRRLSERERAAVTRPFQPHSEGWTAQFPIVVRA